MRSATHALRRESKAPRRHATPAPFQPASQAHMPGPLKYGYTGHMTPHPTPVPLLTAMGLLLAFLARPLRWALDM